MKERCYNPKRERFENYGGRGITVCERWRNSFRNFLDDMGRRPSPDHSIERIDVNGHYEPSNCKWVTTTEQRANMRCTVYLESNGQVVKLVDLAKQLGINRNVVYQRLKLGWSVEDAIAMPVRTHRRREAI